MSLHKKMVMKGTTRLSLHDRFTFLRSQSEQEPVVHVQSVRQGLFRSQPASFKNRQLAQTMDRRPGVVAALKLRNKYNANRARGRAGKLSVKDRLTLLGRGGSGLRGRLGQRGSSTGRSPLVRQQQYRQQSRGYRGGGRSMSRSQSLTNLSRSQSMQSLNGRQRSTSARGGGRFQSRNRPTFNRGTDYRRGGRGRGLRARGGGDRFGKSRDDFRGRRGGSNFTPRFSTRGQRGTRGFRSRGGGGVGRGRGRGGRGPPPTKEELDTQLDQYMATSRHELDRELDSYMSRDETWD